MNYFLSLAIAAAAFFSSQALAWTVSADFEYPQATANTVANLPNPDSFHDAAGQSRYADTPALSGSMSGSVTATAGETGFGRWGGTFTFPEPLAQGDEIWYRVNVYYPTGWTFQCNGCNQGLKFMRIATTSATGGNQGYLSTLIGGGVGVSGVSAGTTGGLINVDSEVPNGFYDGHVTMAERFGVGTPIQRDQWHTYEMYVKFSSVRNQAIYRVWQDGNLIFEDKISGTLVSPTSISGRAMIYTFWNNGAPKTQTSYVDDIVITNEVPGRRDAHGNPYIGVGPSIYIAPPKAPTPTGG